MKLNLLLRWAVFGGVLVGGPAGVLAAVFNGDFETGNLGGWSAVGAAYARQFELPRDFLPPVAARWEAAEGEYFASLWSTDNADSASSWSTLQQTFYANANEVLSFWYFFDYGKPVALGRDWAVVTLYDHTENATELLLEINTPGFELQDGQNVGWTYFSHVLPFAGPYTLSFTIYDGAAGEFGFESIFGIDAVEVIPEPAAGLLALAGLLLVGRGRARRAWAARRT